ncbi:hypothetical protein, partial [Salmonella enterica]|uniref:hypothetical protein n=1 Tax=Salmonella enterica TaxID=28901 RepID=UPI003296F79D
YHQRYVTEVLAEFNAAHRPLLDEELGLQSQPLDLHTFLRFVGAGQPSLLHLAKFIQDQYHSLLNDEVGRIHEQFPGDGRKREELL